MSRIGKQSVQIPKDVEVNLEPRNITLKGPKGELKTTFSKMILVSIEGESITFKPAKDLLKARQLWGLTRTLVQNMVHGVTEGFSKQLEIHGVGYRAELQDRKIVLKLGFSHPVEFILPEGIEAKIEANVITLIGIDKQKVGQVAAEIRKLRAPEPYKGKGIRYVGEQVRRKAGKAAAAKVAGS